MRNNKRLYFLSLLFPLSLFVSQASAKDGRTEGSLNGYVTDAVTKKPLPGVVVSATIPGSSSPKEVLTDSDGYFRFPQLPASPVTIQFGKKGYQQCKRPGVQIKEKTTVKLNVEFLPDGVEAPADKEDNGSDESSEYTLLRMVQAG